VLYDFLFIDSNNGGSARRLSFVSTESKFALCTQKRAPLTRVFSYTLVRETRGKYGKRLTDRNSRDLSRSWASQGSADRMRFTPLTISNWKIKPA